MGQGSCDFRCLRVLLFLGAALLFGSAFRDDPQERLDAAQLVERHLASIARPEQLNARKAFAVQGDCEYRLLSGGALAAPGTGQLVSQGRAYNILFDFAAGEYGGT